jgi:hypothetical protein
MLNLQFVNIKYINCYYSQVLENVLHFTKKCKFDQSFLNIWQLYFNKFNRSYVADKLENGAKPVFTQF